MTKFRTNSRCAISWRNLQPIEVQYDHLELSKSKLLYLSSETSLEGSQCVKMTVTLGHFDIWDIWNLHIFLKMSLILLVHHVYWWDFSRKHYQILLNVRIHPHHPPKHTKTIKNTLRHPRHTLITPGTVLTTHQAFWEAFQLSGDVRESSEAEKVS